MLRPAKYFRARAQAAKAASAAQTTISFPVMGGTSAAQLPAASTAAATVITAQPSPYPVTPSDETPFLEPFSQGFHHLSMKVFEKYARFSQIRLNPEELVWEENIFMLATMDQELLRVIVHGNLQLEKRRNAAIRKHLRYLENRASKQPGIYMLELVHKATNVAPTPRQLETVIAIADAYVAKTDHATALRIDQWKANRTATLQGISNGDRAYMEEDIHESKYEVMRDAMKELWAGFTPAEMDHPMRQPLREVGYAKEVPPRLKVHYTHRSSNYLMCLFDAICHVCANQIGAEFTIQEKGELIFLAWRDSQPMLAETLFTALAQADTESGHGFCHADPGDSAWTHYAEAKFKWSVMHEDLLNTSCFLRNIGQEVARIEVRRQMKRDVDVLEQQLNLLEQLVVEGGIVSPDAIRQSSEPSEEDLERMLETLSPSHDYWAAMFLMNEALELLGK